MENTSANFIKMEHEVLKFWEDNECFEKLKEKNKDNKPFRFLDGPITANNPMGIHHAWGRTLKDVFIRYKSMHGYSCHYRNGFDSQGLWVEVEVEKELGFDSKKDIEKYGMDNFTRKCVDRITKFSKRITEQSIRLGQWMEWENSYFTHVDSNITGIWTFLKKCHEKGWITESYRPMPWCPRCGTSLSEHEMTGSYKEIEHTSVFFKLPIKNQNRKILVWTTTPWTLTSNVALAINPNIDYCEVEVKSDQDLLIIAKDSLNVLGDDKSKVVRIFKGKELIGLEYDTCFNDFKSQENVIHKIVPWEIVDPKEGTGVVHIAPGCGNEDFELGKELNLPQVMPVDDNGVFFEGFGWLSGKNIKDVTNEIFDNLKNQNKLYKTHLYKHSYPVCWRCKNEVIFRLVRAWYIKTDEIKPKLIEAANNVKWEPEYIGKRMNDWLINMGDWNISRKRFYGLPLPFYPCDSCGELTVIGSKEDLKKYGAEDVDKLPELHRPWIDEITIKCPKCGKNVSRIPEVGDVWLDAGITPFTTLGYFEDKENWKKFFPIEWVTEMREQVRLWFYSLLFMSVTLEEKAPYEKVLAYNTVISEDGSKFSKTGFMIQFDEAAEKIGADPVRYLFTGANIASDVRFGFSLGDEARRKLLGFWNIYVFFTTYANLDMPNINGFKPELQELSVTDKWLMARTNEFVRNAKDYMDSYQAYSLVKEFEIFVDEVSNWYIRINRRRFWKTTDMDDKRIAYWCLYNSIISTVKVMSPIIPFLTEYIWQHMIRKFDNQVPISVHLNEWPEPFNGFDNSEIIVQTKLVRDIIALALRLRNEQQIKLRQPISCMYLIVKEEYVEVIENMYQVIKDELNIKRIEFAKDSSKLDEQYLIVNFKSAGAVLKGDVQKMKRTLETLDSEIMNKLIDEFDKGDTLDIPGWSEKYSTNLFLKQSRPKKDIVIGKEGENIVALDVNLSEDLIIEGAIRDVIRQCQLLRKEADLKVEQRIVLGLSTKSERLKAAVIKYSEHIKEEILAENILDNVVEAKISKTIEILNNKIEITIGNTKK
ncbi:MAG: isoleucine--tRNA ligase [Clostridiales bacterium]